MSLERVLIVQRTVGIDLLYSFVIVSVSLLIYYGTRELDELSNHKGIRYFRLAFLFFALAFAFRFLTQWLFLTFGVPQTWQIHPALVGLFALALFTYASSAAIFYVWSSVHWRTVHAKRWAMPLLHVLAVFISLLCITTANLILLLVVQFILLVFLAATIYRTDRPRRRATGNLRIIYALLAVFWVLNILDILISDLFATVHLVLYLASVSLFLIMLYRVIQKTGAR